MNNKVKSDGRKDCLIYCRVSTNKQEEKQTIESQVIECTKYAEAHGYRVAETVRETFSGAYLFDRPKLNEQREKIRAGLYDAVICYDIDRLSRKIAHFAIIADEIERHGAQLLFVNTEFDDTPEGELMRSVKSYVAQVERLKIKERTNRGKKHKVQSGKLVRAADLYGYRFDNENKRRVINPTEVATVKRIFEMYLSGIGIRGIFRVLNAENIPTPATNKRNLKSPKYTNLAKHGRTLWNQGVIKRILTEPAYSGHTIAWRYKGERGFENGERYYRIKKRDESEWIEMPEGTTPAIITPEQFRMTQERLQTNKGEATRNAIRPELLRGMVFCGDCGTRMRPETEKKKAKNYELKIFRCPSRHTIKCNGKRINAVNCETAVWEKITDIIKNPHIVAAEMERRKTDSQADRQKIENELSTRKDLLARIESEITNLVSRSATVDNDTWKLFEKEIKTKNDEKKRIVDAIGEMENRLASFDADNQAAKALAEFSNRVSQNLAEFGFDEKRLTLEALNVKITGNGKEFRLDVSYPSIIEKQVNVTNHSYGRFAWIGKDDAGEKIADDSAAA